MAFEITVLSYGHSQFIALEQEHTTKSHAEQKQFEFLLYVKRLCGSLLLKGP